LLPAKKKKKKKKKIENKIIKNRKEREIFLCIYLEEIKEADYLFFSFFN
jgi:hypothetical protein